MFTFFRQIRKSLLASSQSRKYILYAAGEILLVMVGILLALQVNNWNENRKELIREKQMLTSFHEELLANRRNINNMRLWHEDIQSAILTLLDEAASDQQSLSKNTIDTLIAMISWFNNASTFQMSAIDAIITSGQLSIIKSDLLKQKITAWNRDVLDVVQIEKQDYDNFSSVWMPYLTNASYLPQISNAAITQPGLGIENYLGNVSLRPTLKDHSTLLMDVKFQNLLLQRLWIMNDILYEYSIIEPKLEQLIESVEGVIKVE